MIHLEPVTPENWRYGLRVREDQHCFAADSAGLLARAYAYRAQRSEALVIGPGLRYRGRQAASAKTEDRRKI